jgi:peroxiredoxin family protein
MSNKLIFNCTYGKEDPERATLPFVAANIAAAAGQEAVVLCTIEAVWLGTEGGTVICTGNSSTTAATYGCAAHARSREGSPKSTS